jgi:prepilin-type N-terminal cleavage/methylation domain-containing protein
MVNKPQGLTLIELLIVVSILIVLAGIAVDNYMSPPKKLDPRPASDFLF